MGQWGISSFDSDSCMDYMRFEDDANPVQVDCDETMNAMTGLYASYKPKTMTADFCQDYAGCVIWILRHGFMVEGSNLRKALGCLNRLLKDRPYIANWDNPEARYKEIEREKNQIADALIGNGTIPKETVAVKGSTSTLKPRHWFITYLQRSVSKSSCTVETLTISETIKTHPAEWMAACKKDREDEKSTLYEFVLLSFQEINAEDYNLFQKHEVDEMILSA